MNCVGLLRPASDESEISRGSWRISTFSSFDSPSNIKLSAGISTWIFSCESRIFWLWASLFVSLSSNVASLSALYFCSVLGNKFSESRKLLCIFYIKVSPRLKSTCSSSCVFYSCFFSSRKLLLFFSLDVVVVSAAGSLLSVRLFVTEFLTSLSSYLLFYSCWLAAARSRLGLSDYREAWLEGISSLLTEKTGTLYRAASCKRRGLASWVSSFRFLRRSSSFYIISIGEYRVLDSELFSNMIYSSFLKMKGYDLSMSLS